MRRRNLPFGYFLAANVVVSAWTIYVNAAWAVTAARFEHLSSLHRSLVDPAEIRIRESFERAQRVSSFGQTREGSESVGGAQTGSLLDEIKSDMIDAAGHLCAVDPALIRSVGFRESGWRWQVHPVSGASGYMQIVPRWVRGGPERQRRVATEPWSNIVEGACRLRRYIDRFGLPAALHAYHGGPTRVMQGRVLAASLAYADGILGGNEE